jgi:hypothetical protein
MTPPRKELVIEVECVRVVRRRVPAFTEYCAPCGRPVDSIEAAELSAMFETTRDELVARLTGLGVHLNLDRTGRLSVCYNSLQTSLRRENLLPRNSLAGG